MDMVLVSFEGKIRRTALKLLSSFESTFGIGVLVRNLEEWAGRKRQREGA